MVYLGCYLFIGLLLVVINSPVRRLVDSEITKIELHYAVSDEEVPVVKIILLRLILSSALVIFYPFMLFSEFKERKASREEIKGYQTVPMSHQSWLQNQITQKEAEAEHMVEIDGRKVPFGRMNLAWLSLLDNMQDGDKLYEFQSSDDSWQHLAGRQGIALVRDGEIVADIVTVMN